MRLTEILQPAFVKVDLAATDKQQAISELVDLLGAADAIEDVEALREAVWNREQTRTTGIGHGIAIPHGKIAQCTHLTMALGKTATPIEFGAIDGRPVELIFLLASPRDQTGPHIQALAQISHLLTDDDFRTTIMKASSAEEIYGLIAGQEAKAPA
ncbi:MAG: hypothetical protein CMJ18_24035 [Phycisphaeraceae bacterium]|nr:hypothetical protein [Phycisphaeraceae bacterium]